MVSMLSDFYPQRYQLDNIIVIKLSHHRNNYFGLYEWEACILKHITRKSLKSNSKEKTKISQKSGPLTDIKCFIF